MVHVSISLILVLYILEVLQEIKVRQSMSMSEPLYSELISFPIRRPFTFLSAAAARFLVHAQGCVYESGLHDVYSMLHASHVWPANTLVSAQATVSHTSCKPAPDTVSEGYAFDANATGAF